MSDSDGTRTIRTTEYVAMLNELHQLRAEVALLREEEKLHESHAKSAREKTDQLRAEVERLSDELNAEKLRTCERCIEKTVTRCAEIVEGMHDCDSAAASARAIRKEFGL